MHKYPYLEQVCREHGYLVTCDEIIECLKRSDDLSKVADREKFLRLLKKQIITREEAVIGLFSSLYRLLSFKKIDITVYDEEMQQCIADDLERLLFDESLAGNV